MAKSQPESEVDRIVPDPETVKFSTGFAIEVMRLKTRQLFRLLKVLTHGAGPALMQAQLDFEADAAVFGQKLLALVIISIPDAENEFIEFLLSMAKPAGLVEKKGGKLSKQETEDNAAKWSQFYEELNNPDPDDLMEMVEVIIEVEAPELQALGKRIAGLVATLRQTGAAKDKPSDGPSPEELNSESPGASPESSTS